MPVGQPVLETKEPTEVCIPTDRLHMPVSSDED